MSNDKKNKMTAFWSERAKQYGSDPRANTNDIWLREIEVNFVDGILQQYRPQHVMDFGCANGYSTFKLAGRHDELRFVGIDVNAEMIDVAQARRRNETLRNIEFRLCDVQSDEVDDRFDFIYAIRVFQNMKDQKTQMRIFTTLRDLLVPGGLLLYVESYLDGYAKLNEDRVALGLPPLPIHEHLTLLTDEFDDFASNKMTLIRRDYLSSSYYLVTRLLYSYIAKTNNEPIDYNHPIHQVGALIPQVGNYGPQRAALYQKV